MKEYPIRWMRMTRMVVLWVVSYLLITYGLFWFPDCPITIGVYTITKSIVTDAFAILVVAKSINMIMRTFIWDYLVARMLKGLTPFLLIQIVSMCVYFIALLVIIGTVFGKSVTGFLATFGALGVVIGFGIQKLLLDVFSGVSLSIDSPFSLGDYIQVKAGTKEYSGIVQSISWRLTTILTDQKSKISIPNSVISGNPLVNFSRPTPISEFEQVYYFPHTYDDNFIRKTLMNAALSAHSTGFIESKIKVSLSVLEPGRLGYKVKYLVDPLKKGGPGKGKNALHTAVLKHTRAAGLEFHNPNQRILIHKDLSAPIPSIKEKLLNLIPLFRCLNQKEIDSLIKNFIMHNFIEHEEIVKEGGDGSSMYIIAEGFVFIEITNEKKEKCIVATLNPGDFFGEMALLTGEARTATVRAAADVVAYEITKDSLKPLLEDNPTLYKDFASVIAVRNAHTKKTLTESADKKENKINLVDDYLKKIRNFFTK